MEQNANTGAPMTSAVENKQKSGNGLKIVTAIACIVAVCGIGFGVYGMIQNSQKDSQIANLTAQIQNYNNTTNINTDILISKIDSTKDWVYDAEYQKNTTAESYTTSFGNTYYSKDIVVPFININSTYAEMANNSIKNIFDKVIETYNSGVDNKTTYIDECSYESFKNDNNLSVLLTYGIGGTDVVHPIYYTYNIDLETGRELTYQDIYKIAGFDSNSISSKVESAITEIMEEKMSTFSQENYPTGTSFETYNNESINNYKESVSNGTLKYFLSDNKKINIVVKLSIPAGTGEFDTIITID